MTKNTENKQSGPRKTYVVSDIHGCYDKYQALLEKIGLRPEDRLYVLGDVVDRGPDGPKILLDMMSRENLTLIRGNHDECALVVLAAVLDEKGQLRLPEYSKVVDDWLSDGGEPTRDQFYRELSERDRLMMLKYIQNGLDYALLEIGGMKYLLAHSIPEIEDFKAMGGLQGLDGMDFSFNETDYDCVYDENVIMVSGHSPTGLIDPASEGRILRRNNHIAIDCGAVFGYPLGCLCLETGEEFYV